MPKELLQPVMKTLYVIRHAKSSWADAFLKDFERSLNERGKRDAPLMAKRFGERGIKPDFIYCSTAKRAQKTAKKFAKQLSWNTDEFINEPMLYLASVATIYETLFSTPDDKEHVCLFGHNPGLTDFVNDVASAGIDNIPTCGIVAIEFEDLKWNQITSHSGKVKFFDYPKKVD
jgi:phosphohistidine phosphatase